MTFDYDYLIIGSGFGGSVSALRLAQKGWRVAVLEQGARVDAAAIAAAKEDRDKLHWLPALRRKGFFGFGLFRHLVVLKGVGVGGGSLVWGAVMLEPKPAFYREPALQETGVDWQAELAGPFARASKMFGITRVRAWAGWITTSSAPPSAWVLPTATGPCRTQSISAIPVSRRRTLTSRGGARAQRL
ncbi:MAG: FAD-binding protein [Halioglobus sp.]